MNPRPNLSKPPIAPPTPNLRLPFGGQRQGNLGDWIYRHRVGLLVTVVIHLSVIILFLSYQIIIVPSSANVIAMEFAKEPEPPVEQIEQPEQKEIETLEEQSYEKIANRVSNRDSKMNASLKDAKNSNAADIYKEAERVQQELTAGKDAFERGMSEVEAMRRRKTPKDHASDNSSGKDDKQQTANIKGNVAVEYFLPMRNDRYLHIPAYQCQAGGKVVVAITVNQNGKVIAATVEQATSTDDPCILDMAIKAARVTTFNTSSSAPEKQKGTITYTFVPQ